MSLDNYSLEELENEVRRRKYVLRDQNAPTVREILKTSPNWSELENRTICIYGRHIGGMGDKWEWNEEKLFTADQDTLTYVLDICLDSWRPNA